MSTKKIKLQQKIKQKRIVTGQNMANVPKKIIKLQKKNKMATGHIDSN